MMLFAQSGNDGLAIVGLLMLTGMGYAFLLFCRAVLRCVRWVTRKLAGGAVKLPFALTAHHATTEEGVSLRERFAHAFTDLTTFRGFLAMHHPDMDAATVAYLVERWKAEALAVNPGKVLYVVITPTGVCPDVLLRPTPATA